MDDISKLYPHDECSVCGHWPEDHSGKNGEICDKCPGLTCSEPDRIIVETLTADEVELLLGALETEIRHYMGEFSLEQTRIDAELVAERLDKLVAGPPYEHDEELEIRGTLVIEYNAILAKLKKILEDHYEGGI